MEGLAGVSRMGDQEQRYNELFSLLMTTLPKKINASNHKTTANKRENRSKNKKQALKICKFIQFNNKKVVQWMIFDIDTIDGKKAIEVYTLNEMVHEIYAKTVCIPTYTLQTEKGYHFAFHLENAVFLESKKAKKYLQDIKAAISNVMDCDKIASNRLWGIWRNPLRHNFWYSGEQDYSLSSFRHLTKNSQKKFSKFTCKKNPLSVSINNLVEGQRNDKLFLFAVNFCLSNPSSTYEDLINYLFGINNQANPPLEDDEVLSIGQSAYKRKEAGNLFVPKFADRGIQIGIMNFPKMRNLSYKDYLRETKRRQSLSAERTNALLSQKAKEKAMQKAREAKIDLLRKSNIDAIRQAITALKEQQKKLTYVSVAKLTNLDRRTVKKYVQEYDLFRDS